jgi:hypothetical protein
MTTSARRDLATAALPASGVAEAPQVGDGDEITAAAVTTIGRDVRSEAARQIPGGIAFAPPAFAVSHRAA